MTPAESKRRLELGRQKRRAEEVRTAYDLLTRPSADDWRLYDPAPDRYHPNDDPFDDTMYEGTGIGALYGLGGEDHLWQLAGWGVVGLNDGSPVPLDKETT